MAEVQSVTVLGATGSIGRSTLQVIARHPARFRVHALTANRQVEPMLAACRAHRPQVVVMVCSQAAERLAVALDSEGLSIEVQSGVAALQSVAAAAESSVVMAAITGAAGLLPTWAAVTAGKRVLLANKEALVMAGDLMMQAALKHGAQILPIDSEHNAIFQCLPQSLQGQVSQAGLQSAGVARLLLTGSGGPFLTTPLDQLTGMDVAAALAHPTWQMGPKISIDSATMMNKGLELIEACWLFDVTPAQIEVVLHPQSVIHSMVSYVDGSVIAQMAQPDMCLPIAYGLAWPARLESGVLPLDFRQLQDLTFEVPTPERYPCLYLARDALAAGGSASVVLNAANEVAVAAFLAKRIGFGRIAQTIEATLAQMPVVPVDSLAHVVALDVEARAVAEAVMAL